MLDLLLSEDKAIEYVKKNTELFSESEELKANVMAGDRMSVDGLANQVLRVESQEREFSVIVKQVLPFVRIMKERGIHVPLSIERMRTDVQYMRVAKQLCPDYAPKVHLWDETECILVMEDLGRMKIFRSELIDGKKFLGFPRMMGEYLGRIGFLTSEYHLSPWEKASFDQFFSGSYSDEIWKSLIFDSLRIDLNDRSINPLIQDEMLELSGDKAVQREISGLKAAFFQQHQCLIHTDLHSSNIFVSQDELKVFDSEYARYGPIGYDLGQLVASLFLNYASLIGYGEWDAGKIADYQEYLLRTILELYQEFEDHYFSLWDQRIPAREEGRARRKQLIFRQTLGFAACASVQRIYNDILCLDFKRIESLQDRAKGQRFVIDMARRLLIGRYEYCGMDQVVEEIGKALLQFK